MRPELGFFFHQQWQQPLWSFFTTPIIVSITSPQYSTFSIRRSPGGRRCFQRYPLTSLLFETLPKFRQTENKLLQLHTNRSYHPIHHLTPYQTTQPTRTPSPESRLSCWHLSRATTASVAKKGHCQKVFAVRGRLLVFSICVTATASWEMYWVLLVLVDLWWEP